MKVVLINNNDLLFLGHKRAKDGSLSFLVCQHKHKSDQTMSWLLQSALWKKTEKKVWGSTLVFSDNAGTFY